MPKPPNVSIETLMACFPEAGQPTDTTLQNIYEKTFVASKDIRDWYWSSIKGKRQASVCTLRISVFLLSMGTLLPLIAGMTNHTETRLQLTQSAVVSLAMAGLMQVIDRVFGLSSGWLRYITTVTAMEKLTHKFEFDWAFYVLNHAPRTLDDCKVLFEIARNYLDEIQKLRSDETDNWVAEFNRGVALLGEMLKSQRDTANAANSTSKQTGAIILTLMHAAQPVAVTITLNTTAPETFTGLSWSRKDLPPGQYQIKIDKDGFSYQTVTTVSAGEIATVRVTIP